MCKSRSNKGDVMGWSLLGGCLRNASSTGWPNWSRDLAHHGCKDVALPSSLCFEQEFLLPCAGPERAVLAFGSVLHVQPAHSVLRGSQKITWAANQLPHAAPESGNADFHKDLHILTHTIRQTCSRHADWGLLMYLKNGTNQAPLTSQVRTRAT
jgi:hypothetical protein